MRIWSSKSLYVKGNLTNFIQVFYVAVTLSPLFTTLFYEKIVTNKSKLIVLDSRLHKCTNLLKGNVYASVIRIRFRLILKIAIYEV